MKLITILKEKRSEKGFSLIELMVVVAIIGVLASVAIPNFQKFKMRARQSEAKVHLGALYTAEKGFETEWDSYVGCVNAIGFDTDGQPRYDVGFNAFGVNAGAGFSFAGVGQCTLKRDAAANAAAIPAAGALGVAATVAVATFDGAAVAVAANGFDQSDMWTIDETKQITMRQSGIQ